jgi:histidinol dehydrogenase
MSDEIDQILISSSQPDFQQQIKDLHKKLKRKARFGGPEEKPVWDIINKVYQEGDKAVANYTKEFDDVELTPKEFLVTKEELQRAYKKTNADLMASIRRAIKNVRKYQEEIFIANKKENKHPEIKYTPIKRVGICVPGASAPLPSTVIMCAVPAQVAGVKEIVVVSPPRYNKSIHPTTLAVCYELGISEVYRIGGAQAVALLAGTEGKTKIQKVDKIVGPGNQWVQTAKLRQFGYVDIDSIAGPSEVLIIANEKANPAWVATDMLSQAEHAPGSAVLYTDSLKFANGVLAELKKQIKQLGREEETKKCLIEYSKIVAFKDMDTVVAEANDFAAEHLETQCGKDSRKIANRIENAGAIFIGDYSPVTVGDYWAGPSHTLPTGQTAKFFSALSANDFIKATSIIEYDKKKLAESAEDIIRLAEAEGLDAHARSIKIRQEK